MKALLINNKEICIDDTVYQACPELEEYKVYNVVTELFNPRPGHPDIYVIEESDRWLIKTRFVSLQSEDKEEELEAALDYGQLLKY